MGRVRTKTVKRSADFLIERYYPTLTLDFEVNKRHCDEVAIVPSKRLRNKVSMAVSAASRSRFKRRSVSARTSSFPRCRQWT